MKKEKMAYLEMLRVIALFCVLINHTVNGELFWQELGGKKWFVLLVEFLFCRINVPLFLMISGVLLLGRVDTYEKCLRRAFRILVDIVIFSLLYYIWQCHGTGMEVSMAEFRARVLREEITTPLWYLYMYLGILILLPLLQRMAARMEKRDYQYLIVLAIVACGSLPVAGHYIGWLRLNPEFFRDAFAGIYRDFFLWILSRQLCGDKNEIRSGKWSRADWLYRVPGVSYLVGGTV